MREDWQLFSKTLYVNYNFFLSKKLKYKILYKKSEFSVSRANNILTVFKVFEDSWYVYKLKRREVKKEIEKGQCGGSPTAMEQ